MRNVSINNLSQALVDVLNDYREEVTEDLKSDIMDAANFCKSEIQRRSPQNSGEYKRGWRIKKQFENSSVLRVVIYNAKKPSLTHLLEKGHPIIGRKTKKIIGVAKAVPHIEPAEQAAEKKLINAIEIDVK